MTKLAPLVLSACLAGYLQNFSSVLELAEQLLHGTADWIWGSCANVDGQTLSGWVLNASC